MLCPYKLVATKNKLLATRRSHGCLLGFARDAAGHVGPMNSILQIGPPAYIGPSDRKKTGASPPKIQILKSGGCLPISGATTPAIEPNSTFTTKCIALRRTPPIETCLLYTSPSP